ncbi:glutamate-rich protein 6 isoform X3 [Hemicordylus capensis]|uniref:glutamate-rich protein 6 isoform X3 n=2 Tax=Hemicordylus capensis TaxID=884348 RepID=UPI00230360E6|nr:glutamate-rich protein 6 isoform X3 [Hemicordylus capensis]
MEDASGNPGKESDEAEDLETKVFGHENSPPTTDTAGRAPEDGKANPEYGGNKKEGEMEVEEPDTGTGKEMQLEEATEKPDTGTGSELPPGRVQSRTSRSSDRSSYKEIQEEEAKGSPEPEEEIAPPEEVTEPPSPEATTAPSPRTAGTKGYPSILGGVRRESSSTIYKLSREALDTVAADALQKGISVAMQTDRSWIYDQIFKKKAPKFKRQRIPPENDIYAVLSQDLSSLEILCDMEFKEDFLKLFQESLHTLSSVGPPTILAYRRESSRKDLEIAIERDYQATCQYCGSPLRDIPSFESLEELADYGPLFCCQHCRDLHEFLVNERRRYAKQDLEQIAIAPHKAHGSKAEREQAKEKARQRMRERQMARQFAYAATEQEKETVPVHSMIEYNKQLRTISYSMAQMSPSLTSWTKIPLSAVEKQASEDITYNISCCDFTIAGGKLLKNQFLQQYYKNGVKFLTIFPDGSAQIFYPSGNLAIIVVQKKENTGYICIVQEDRPENPDIQGVFESSGKGTCYHPNGIVWINITIRGGHYSDQDGNRVRTWIWPNHLHKRSPTVEFKPVFLSLNLNVGVRILGQDKIAISFLAMGKQARINVGTKVEPSADHHPLPKHVSEEDLLLFACRIKILKIFDRLHGCLEFPTNDRWTKLETPSYLSKKSLQLMYLCRECEVNSALDGLITAIVNSPT